MPKDAVWLVGSNDDLNSHNPTRHAFIWERCTHSIF